MSLTPFGYIKGPHYTYEITAWTGETFARLETIYVGRGRGRRALAYYRLTRRRGVDRYYDPKGHNPGLDAAIKAVRKDDLREIGIIAHDHGWSLVGSKRDEKRLIRKHGRRDLGNGTLFNRYWGG